MKINILKSRIANYPFLNSLLENIQYNSEGLNLTNAHAYYDFPVYRGLDQEVLVVQLMIVSEYHGILIFYISDQPDKAKFLYDVPEISIKQENLFSLLFTKLLRNPNLRKDKTSLITPINNLIIAPLLEKIDSPFSTDLYFFQTVDSINYFLSQFTDPLIEANTYIELISTIEGAKGMIKSKKREPSGIETKGAAVTELEKEMVSFDQYQVSSYSSPFVGVSRIRGLAGSGKTIVLAIKAAIIHLRYPDAKIAYTFYTKSLYQLIKRLITRFYRQFEEQDPNWENLQILHAWGSQTNPGIYYNACKANNVPILSFSQAKVLSKDAFESACLDFLEKAPRPDFLFDYIFIDEGQDFPTSFLKLCISITNGNKVIWAYDELQTIFRPRVPTPSEIFGVNEKGEPKIEIEDDIILYKCYRNPREILVTAHAVGFGIYNPKIAQMIENEDYWKDIGYEIVSGRLAPGEHIKILRPEENSLISISKKYSIDEIVKVRVFDSYKVEIIEVARSIHEDISDGLLPEDILVITVDDRAANAYLNGIQDELGFKYNISVNNIHADKFSLKDFQIPGSVTLSTIHKAKGNEAYSVYVVGIDALFTIYASVRDRNVLFTAMTRAKGWVQLSGVGDPAESCKAEIDLAKKNFPYLEFDYPSAKDLKVMQRDLKEKAIRKSKAQKTIDKLLEDLSPEDIQKYLQQKFKGE